MAPSDENVTLTPAPRQRLSRSATVGVWAFAVSMVILLALTFLPTAYVIQQPGPVYNTLGTATAENGDEVPLISVEGAETYPTDGTLDLLTVQVVGNRERTPAWTELATAWFDPTKAVLPIDAIFPEGQTSEERSEESAGLMTDSQNEAGKGSVASISE